jgi:hypothetical protein
VLPVNECVANLGALTWICILVAVIFWILRAIKVMYHLFQFWDIKQFFNTALKINDVSIEILFIQTTRFNVIACQMELKLHQKTDPYVWYSAFYRYPPVLMNQEKENRLRGCQI